uniref:Uncharacterized protein n=1 Tax=Lepeophtheirus salmonis TaxID=72036 RepID=A0A0K2SZX6_LEPSM
MLSTETFVSEGYRAVQNYLPIFVQNISRTIMTFE